jgi:hypothetical protein
VANTEIEVKFPAVSKTTMFLGASLSPLAPHSFIAEPLTRERVFKSPLVRIDLVLFPEVYHDVVRRSGQDSCMGFIEGVGLNMGYMGWHK